jgi:uncharacterized membrane protein YedE/YeeE
MIILLALGCGILFGAGLAISGMINPQKVLAFLDVGGIPSGTWDPTLGFEIPTRRDVDARLIAGAAIFGAGWGLAGLCPGPAVAALPAVGSQLPALVVFIIAMLAGIWLSTKITSAPVPEPERAPT